MRNYYSVEDVRKALSEVSEPLKKAINRAINKAMFLGFIAGVMYALLIWFLFRPLGD